MACYGGRVNSPFLRPPRRCPRSLSLPRFVLSLLVGTPVAVLPPNARADLPTGAQVVHGDVSIAQAGSRMTIDQASHHAIVNWQSFNLGAGEQFRLNQPGVDAAMLARVVGGDPSLLLGALKADGKLFLINPRGVIVGEGATIDTAAFTASTLDVSDAEFLAGGAMTFKGDSNAGIVNLGKITAREGNVMLFAHTVKNAGEIAAPNGTAALAAGTEVFVAENDDASFVIKVNLPAATGKTGVENSGVIDAARVELKAAGGSIYEMAINQSGVIRANGIETRNGRVLLTAEGGTVGVSGRVEAHNADGSGGEILVGGDYRGGNKDVPNSARTVITATASLDASATTDGKGGGKVIVWADDATRFLGRIDAAGSGGGFAEVSGKRVLDFRPAARIELGEGGTLLLDPEALVISNSADNGTSASAGDPFTFGANTEPATLSVATLQDQLAASNVVLDTSLSAGDIVFSDAVTWTTGSTLTAKAGGSIAINANLTGGAGSSLVLRPGKAADPDVQGSPAIFPNATLDAAATITAGTLVYGSNPDAAPAGYTLNGTGTVAAFFDGDLDVDTLEIDLSGGGSGVGTFGSDNAIGTLRTTGTGNLSYLRVIDHHGDLDVQLASANATAPQVRITTPGELTLKAGTSLSFARATDVILASTGDRFVNEAGAGAIGANGRFLIYSSTGSATEKDGLTGIDVYSHTYDEADDFSGDSASRFLYRLASGLPFLNYTADSKTRTYGGSDPAFTATVTGFLEGVPDDVTGLPAFSTTATQSSGVGTYSINVARGTLASTNYDFAFSAGSLVVTAAPLTIAANDASRHLNRPNPAFTASYTGLVNGDEPSVVTGLTFSTTAVTGSPAGSYPITLSGGTAANYTLSFEPGTLTVGGFSTLTIAANNVTKIYGEANPAFSATITGLEEGDDDSLVTGLRFSTTATQSSGAGTYTISPYGASASGYQVQFVPGTLTIDRAPLTIIPLNLSRSYGNPNPAVAFNAAGLVNGDTSAVVSGLSLHTSATQGSNVGDYALTLSGGVADNYALTIAGGATLTVNPAVVTVTVDDKTRRYGDADPVFTYSVSGLKNSDPASLIEVTGLESFATATAGIGDYGIFANVFAWSTNYTVNRVLGTLSITPRPLTISAPSFSRKYYDLDPISSPELVDDAMKADPRYAATFTGLAPFDTAASIPDVKLTTQATLRSGASMFGILVSSGLNPNYTINHEFGSLTITPRPLYFSVDDFTKVYGRENPDFTPGYDRGLAPIDTLAGLGLRVDPAILSARDVGTYEVGYRITNPNYQLFDADLSTPLYNAPLASQLSITPAPLTVIVGGNGRLYGEANPALNVQVLGLAFGEKAEEVLAIFNPTVPTTSVGRYDYDVTLKGATPNYTIAENRSGQFQINPRLVTAAVDLAARYYGDANPAFTATFGGDGLASFDSMSAVVEGFKTAVQTHAMTDVGIYRIDPVFKANPNYLVSWKPGYLAILPRPIELIVNDGIAFGNNNLPEGFSVGDTGLDLVRYTFPGTTGHTVTATNLPAGVTFGDIAPDLYFEPSNTNDPSAVTSTLTPEQFLAQFVPPPTTPTEPAPAGSPTSDSGVMTAIFTPGTLPEPTVPSIPSSIIVTDIVVVGTMPVLNPTPEQKKNERFADAKSFIIPKAYGNKNYAVTKITNGVLTMKADPAVVNATLTAEETKRKRDAAEDAFFGKSTPGGIVLRRISYGFSSDMNILIFEALGLAIDQDYKNGNVGSGSIVHLINGGVETDKEITGDDMIMWLGDFHSNPAKQALLMPIMLNYAMTIAYQDPATWTVPQAKLMEQMKPFIAEGRQQFIESAKAAQAEWNTGNADVAAGSMAGGIGGLYGLAVTPYEKFIGAAVESSVAKAMSGIDEKLKARTGGMTEQELAGYIGLGAGGAAGAVVGTMAGAVTIANVLKIMPNLATDIKRAALALKGVLEAGETTVNTIQRGSKVISTTKMLSNAAAGPAMIISFAIEAAITQGMRAGEEEKQKANFNALLNSGSDPVDPHAMMQTDMGRAQMMLGLITMFGG